MDKSDMFLFIIEQALEADATVYVYVDGDSGYPYDVESVDPLHSLNWHVTTTGATRSGTQHWNKRDIVQVEVSR